MEKTPKTLWFAIALFVLLVTGIIVLVFSVLKLGEDSKDKIKPEALGNWAVAKYESVSNEKLTEKQFEVLKKVVEKELRSEIVSKYSVEYDLGSQSFTVKYIIDEYNDPDYISTAVKEALNIEGGRLAFKDEMGNTVIDNSHIENADVKKDDYYENSYLVVVNFNEVGTEKFFAVTAANIGKTIYIHFNDTLLCCPIVSDAISTGQCTITGNFSQEEATLIASQISVGDFSAEFELVDLEY